MRKTVKRQKNKGAIGTQSITRAKLEGLIKSEMQHSKQKELDNQ